MVNIYSKEFLKEYVELNRKAEPRILRERIQRAKERRKPKEYIEKLEAKLAKALKELCSSL